jgi:hypothetical protein
MAAVISTFVVRQIFFNVLLIMTSDSSQNLGKAQKVGAAESDPEYIDFAAFAHYMIFK